MTKKYNHEKLSSSTINVCCIPKRMALKRTEIKGMVLKRMAKEDKRRIVIKRTWLKRSKIKRSMITKTMNRFKRKMIKRTRNHCEAHRTLVSQVALVGEKNRRHSTPVPCDYL